MGHVSYFPQKETHENLIEKITRIKSIYETLNIILFSKLNFKRDEIENKIRIKIKYDNLDVLYSKEEEFTRKKSQKSS